VSSGEEVRSRSHEDPPVLRGVELRDNDCTTSCCACWSPDAIPDACQPDEEMEGGGDDETRRRIDSRGRKGKGRIREVRLAKY